MKLSIVREKFPNQYVKLTILDSYVEGNKQYVTDVSVIEALSSSEEATKQLLQSKYPTIVYHTNDKKIIIEERKPVGIRGLRILNT